LNNTEQALIILVVTLIGVSILNFYGDYTFRGAQIQINEMTGQGFIVQQNINDNQTRVNLLIAEVLEQLDKDVRSNMKVIDQLTGLLLRGEF